MMKTKRRRKRWTSELPIELNAARRPPKQRRISLRQLQFARASCIHFQGLFMEICWCSGKLDSRAWDSSRRRSSDRWPKLLNLRTSTRRRWAILTEQRTSSFETGFQKCKTCSTRTTRRTTPCRIWSLDSYAAFLRALPRCSLDSSKISRLIQSLTTKILSNIHKNPTRLYVHVLSLLPKKTISSFSFLSSSVS